MKVVIFAGPTLKAAEIQARLDAVVLPPAGHGDVVLALRRHRPRAIGLIDGVFRERRAVWHRELLFALSQGVHVFGAASMGALRAAELDRFGMVGIGRIYEAYRDGAWPGFDDPFEDDDEVAVLHAPESFGAAALSEALVDLRATLALAEEAGAIDRPTRTRVLAALKALPFAERSFARLDALAGISLAPHRVLRKRLDAIELCEALSAHLATDPAPFMPAFRLERPLVWQDFLAQAERTPNSEAEADVLDRLRLDPVLWCECALAAAGRRAATPPPPDPDRALADFRAARGLFRRADLESWLLRNDLDEAGLLRLLALDPDRPPPLPPAVAMLDHLRLTGRYESLRAAPVQTAEPPESEIPLALDWYFATMVPGGRPADIAAFRHAMGWRNAAHFEAAVWRLWREGRA